MNRIWTLCVIGLLSLGAVAWSNAATAGGSAEEAVTALEQQWLQSNLTNNPDLAAPLFADTVTFTGLNTKTRDKATFLADEKATTYTSAELQGLKVRAYGDAAIATYVFVAKGTESGKAFALREAVTDTWVKMAGGQWQLVASHSSTSKD